MVDHVGHVGVRNLAAQRWAWRVALGGLWLLGGVAVVTAVDPDGIRNLCVTPVVLLAGTASLLSYRQGRSLVGVRRQGAPGKVAVEGDVLVVERLGRVVRVPCADVISGWTEPGATGSGDEVVLLTRGGLEVRVAVQRGGGEALLHDAGVAADQRAVKIHVPAAYVGQGRFAMVASVAFLAPLVLLGTAVTVLKIVASVAHSQHADAGDVVAIGGAAMVTVVCALSAWLLLERLAGTTLTIGTDGVVVEHLQSRRLVRRSALGRVTERQGVVVIAHADGPPLRILSTPEAAAVAVARIRAAGQVTAEALSAPVERLDRGDRPVAEWLEELRALTRNRGGYREAAFDRQALFAVVKDGAAPPERRLAAAAALSTRRDPEDRAALRIAADTCADERLRVVLDHAGEAELGAEDLESAVAKLRSA